MTTQTPKRRDEIIAIWKQYQGLYVVAGILIGLLMFPMLELIITNLSELLIGLVPEAIGIVFTVLIIDQLYQQREDQKEKNRLFREMNNQDSGIVMRAVSELRAHGWLEDGSLQGVGLGDVNFEGVNLKRANLSGARWLNDDKLVKAQRLWLVTMPDGTRYNGRFNLIADIERAKEQGIDINNPIDMARDYGVSVAEYEKGQQWALENAEWLKSNRAQANLNIE